MLEEIIAQDLWSINESLNKLSGVFVYRNLVKFHYEQNNECCLMQIRLTDNIEIWRRHLDPNNPIYVISYMEYSVDKLRDVLCDSSIICRSVWAYR